MKIFRKTFLFSFCLILWFFASFLFVSAQTATLLPQTTDITFNTTFGLTLDVSSVTDLFGVAFDLIFDPSLMQFVNATEGGFLSQGCQTSLMTAENPAGTLIVGLTRLGSLCGGVSGSGNLMTLNFQSLNVAGTNNLTFANNAFCVLSGGNCNFVTGTWIPASITVSTSADTTPPSCSNGSPSGTLSSGTTATTLSLSTNENATCKYSTTAGMAYSSMANTFSTTGGTSHSQNITGLTDGGNYYYYARCIDESDNPNTLDYSIIFSINSTTASQCSSFTYSEWEKCESNNIQSRTLLTRFPGGCIGGNPITTQSCVYIPTTPTPPAPSGGGGGGGGDGGYYYDTTPPSQPKNFTLTPANNQITLTWNNPTNSDFVRVSVFKSTTTITENIIYSSIKTKADLIYEGTKEEYTDINLNNDTTYYYAIYAYDKKPNYTKPIIISSKPIAGKTSVEVKNGETLTESAGSESTTIEQTLTGPFSIGMNNDQVKLLQEYLSQDKEVYPEQLTTSYYGNLTTKAVQRFQCKYNIVCSGTPGTTGYGLAGPQTRIKLNEVFGGGSGSGITMPSTDNEALIVQLKEQIYQLKLQLTQLLQKIVVLLQEKLGR